MLSLQNMYMCSYRNGEHWRQAGVEFGTFYHLQKRTQY